MFNVKVKEEFLNTDGKSQEYEYRKLFESLSEIEKEKNKDLYDFYTNEYIELQLSKTQIVLVYEYIDWAIRMCHKEVFINMLTELLDDDYFD